LLNLRLVGAFDRRPKRSNFSRQFPDRLHGVAISIGVLCVS
jgi:hypothetical protein